MGLVFALFMMYYSFVHYQRKEFDRNAYLLWQGVWALFAIMILYPSMLAPLQSTLQLQRMLDLLFILGLGFVLSSTYYNFILLKKMQKKLEKLVRNIAEKK